MSLDIDPQSLHPGVMVQTRGFRLLYRIVRIDKKRNRVICKPITYSHFSEHFVFPPDYLIRVESISDSPKKVRGTELLQKTP